MIVSKCGISSAGSKRSGYAEFLHTIAEAGRELPLIVCRGDFGAADEPVELWPNIITIGGVPDWDDADYNVDTAYQRIMRIAALNPKIQYWMYFNEREDVETRIADFYIALLPRLSAVGIGLCMFNSSSGRPQYSSIDPIPYREISRACAFAKMHGYKAIIGLHEYESADGAHTIGRYRVLADYLESRGALLPIAITEWGHETNDNNADYMRFVREADPIYMTDDRVIGCALWTLGRGSWAGSDYSSMLPQLGEYIATVQPVEPEPKPAKTLEERVTALEARVTALEDKEQRDMVPLYGLHDEEGARWMLDNGKRGVALCHVLVQSEPLQLDFTEFAQAGIDVLLRICYGYADGNGTLPPPDRLAAFEDAVTQTLNNAQGVTAAHYGNEINQPAEFPAGFPLTPAYYVASYNRIWDQVGLEAKLGPAPIDPYYGPSSDNGEWWREILAGIHGADALFLHPKTQTNDPNEVTSDARFTDDPLRWQYLNFRTLETSLNVVPDRFRSLPVYLTECNPQRNGNKLGWQANNTDWISAVKRYLSEWNGASEHQAVSGAVFYRWCDDDWRLDDKPQLLAEIFRGHCDARA